MAPPNLSPCQTAKLVTQQRSSANSTAANLVDSLMNSLLDLVMKKVDEMKAKKIIKRKKQARKVPELTDDEDEEGKGGEGPERKPACCRGKTPTSSSNLTKDQIRRKEETSSLAEEELCLDHLLLREYWHKKKVQERKTLRKMSRATQEASSLTDDSADEAELNQGGPVALSNLAKENTPTLKQEDTPTLKQEDAPTLKQEDAPTLKQENAPTLKQENTPT